ncbi:MAG: hypothetical protein ACOX9C_09875 [Kiritimatiellia bacterium]
MKKMKESRILDSHVRLLFAMLLAVLPGPLAVRAADRTWSNAAGGFFEVSANWVGGLVPGAADTANFTADASYPVRFGSSVTNSHAYFSAPGGTVSFDIGADNLYYVTLFRLQSTTGDACVELPSGTLSAYKVLLGDWAAHHGNKMVVKNPGTSVVTRGDDVYVGSSGGDNVFIVANDASVIAGRTVYAGYNSGGHNNLIVVDGTNSVLGSAKDGNGSGIIIGNKSTGNALRVQNGGTLFCPSSGFSIGDSAGADSNLVFVGSGCLSTNGPAKNTSAHVGNKGSCNAMTVSNGTLVLDFNLNVGLSGSFNRLDVLDGGLVIPRTHLYIGGTTESQSNTVVVSGANSLIETKTFDVNVGNAGHWNTLQVADGGAVVANRCIYVDTRDGSSNNKVLVDGSNSVLRSKGNGASYSIVVGKSGTGNSLVLDNGASFVSDAATPFTVGADAGASSNSVFIGSGCGVANPGLVYVGHTGDCNSLTVSNASFSAGSYVYSGYAGSWNSIAICGGATFDFLGHAHVGYGAGVHDNTLLVTGVGTVLTNQNYDLDVGFNGHGNRMRIADGAEVAIRRSVFVGHNASATNNVLEIEGGTLRSLQTFGGGAQSMTVANAGTLRLCGTNSVLEAKALNILSGSTLDIRFGKEGFTPITATGTVAVDDTTKLVVDARGYPTEGAVVPLLNYGALSGAIPPENITLLPAGTTIDFADGKRISIKLPRGTIIVVR